MPPVMFLNDQTKDGYVARIGGIGADTARQWGSMDAIHMLAHVRRSVEVSLGEVEAKDESNFFVRNIMRPMAFSGFMPWPKGKLKTLPFFLPAPEFAFEKENEMLVGSVERFAEATMKEPARETLHPAFGPLTMERWRRIHGMHIDHHLRQFGV